MYYGLQEKGFYLPALNSQAVTTSYILNVALEKYFRIQRTEVSQGFLFKKQSKINIFEELQRVSAQKKLILGFDSSHLADKTWMINILFKLDSQNQSFQKISDQEGVVGLTRDELNLIKLLDTSMCRKKHLKFFRRTPEQIKKVQVIKGNKKLEKIKRRLQKKKEEGDKIEVQIRQDQIKIHSLHPQDDNQQSKKQKGS